MASTRSIVQSSGFVVNILGLSILSTNVKLAKAHHSLSCAIKRFLMTRQIKRKLINASLVAQKYTKEKKLKFWILDYLYAWIEVNENLPRISPSKSISIEVFFS